MNDGYFGTYLIETMLHKPKFKVLSPTVLKVRLCWHVEEDASNKTHSYLELDQDCQHSKQNLH